MADEEDLSTLPLEDRWVHKVWKVRKAAYEEATAEFQKTPDESAPIFTPFIRDPGLFKGAVTDSNVAAQQDGIAALCGFLEFGGLQACTRTRHHTVGPLAEKGLSSTRAATKTKSLDALLWYVELDTAAPIIEDLLPVLGNKQPKVIAATINAITTTVKAFGCKVVDPKLVLKQLPKLFGHADKNVRAESQALALELYRWLRDAMKPTFWNELKPVQQKELDEQFDKIKSEPMPRQERLLRSQQAQQASRGGGGDEEQDEGDAGEAQDDSMPEVDAFDLMEPVDVQKAMPETWHESLASTKWKDRKDALDALHAIANVPRIKDDDYGEIARVLAKCMKDANVAVVTVAANCIEDIAKGLRRSFARYRLMVIEPVFERLKEKKQSVVDALSAALDAIFASTSLSDCLEMTLGFVKHRNPNVKLESMRFLVRMLKQTREAPSKTEVKNIAEVAKALFADATEVMRTGGAEVLGILMKIFGERQMNPYLDGLDEIRIKKIKEFCDSAVVKAKDKPVPVAAPKAAPSAVGKKVMGVKKQPVGSKKPSVKTPTAAAAVDPPTPSRLTGPSKLAGSGRSGLPGPGGAVARLQKKLTGPGGAPPPDVGSPRRGFGSRSPEEEPQVAASRLGPPGRSLAGRPIGKPAFSAITDEAPISPRPLISAPSSADRAELEALRTENARLQRQNEDLRAEKLKTVSQMNEIQNHNAQMIEDHTRDMLSIKAKETQLVRARSDAEAAEQTVSRLQREMDRLKRELSRAVRAGSPPASDVGEYSRDASINGSVAPGMGRLNSHGSVRDKRLSYASSGVSEDKENPGYEHPQTRMGPKPGLSSTSNYQQQVQAQSSRGSSTAAVPRGQSKAAEGEGGGQRESWQRAAEVTSALKAKIEQMKLRQGLHRQQSGQQ